MRSPRDIDLFLLDMDGTIYLGDRLFDCTKPFLETVRALGKRYLFLTNNSSKDRTAYVEKLARLGIEAAPDDVFTSGEATTRAKSQCVGVSYPKNVPTILRRPTSPLI